MSKQLQIRNSTAEFLIFQAEDKAEGVQVFYKDESIWATQKAMAMLFDCSTDNIGVHLKNIYESGELQQEATTEKISVVQNEGNRKVSRLVQFYKLDAIISGGYYEATTPSEDFDVPFKNKLSSLYPDIQLLILHNYGLPIKY